MGKYISGIIFKVAFLVILSIMFSIFQNSPIFTNDIALGQMMNSDEAFLNYEFYKAILPIVEIVYKLIKYLICFLIGIDVGKLYRKYKEKKK